MSWEYTTPKLLIRDHGANKGINKGDIVISIGRDFYENLHEYYGIVLTKNNQTVLGNEESYYKEFNIFEEFS